MNLLRYSDYLSYRGENFRCPNCKRVQTPMEETETRTCPYCHVVIKRTYSYLTTQRDTLLSRLSKSLQETFGG